MKLCIRLAEREAGLCEPKRRDEQSWYYGKMENKILISNIQKKSPYGMLGAGFGTLASRAKAQPFIIPYFERFVNTFFEKILHKFLIFFCKICTKPRQNCEK
jgi:hypothetical protein